MCGKHKKLKEGSAGGRIKGQDGFVNRAPQSGGEKKLQESRRSRKAEGAAKGNNPKREGSITVREELKLERNGIKVMEV